MSEEGDTPPPIKRPKPAPGHSTAHWPDYATDRWRRQELKALLKSRGAPSQPKKNPFLGNSRTKSALLGLGCGLVGSGAVAGLYTTGKKILPAKYHLPLSAAIASISMGLPSSCMSAGFGGAAFTALFQDIYTKWIQGKILEQTKAALKQLQK